MLRDEDRIYTNLYGFEGTDLKSARARGTYDGANGCLVHGNGTRFGAFPGVGTNGIALAAQQ